MPPLPFTFGLAGDDRAPGPPEPEAPGELHRLYNFALRLTWNPAAAEALVRDAVRLLRAEGPPDAPERERTARLYAAIARGAETHAAGLRGSEPAVPPPGALWTVEEALAGRILENGLAAALRGLPERYRRVLLLCEVEGFSVEEAAGVLGRSPGTLQAELDEAHDLLHRQLSRQVSRTGEALLERVDTPQAMGASLRHVAQTLEVPTPQTLRDALLAPPVDEPDARTPYAAPEPPAPEPPALEPLPAPEDAPAPRRRPRLVRVLIALALILATGVAGFLVSRQMGRPERVDLVELSAEDGDEVEPALRTSAPEEASRYVEDRLGWRVGTPLIDRATFQGVGMREIASGLTIPVFLYEDVSGEPIRVYIYNYALLDRHAARLRLSDSVLRKIEDDQYFDLHPLGERHAVVWRQSDDIYIAVAAAGVQDLPERIYPS